MAKEHVCTPDQTNKQTTSGLVVHFWVHKLDMDYHGNQNELRITYKNYLILSLCHELMYKKCIQPCLSQRFN